MKKITIYILSILIGLFCLGGGTFLFTADTSVPQQEQEEVGQKYTHTFYRRTDSVTANTIYIWNCTSGQKLSLTRGSTVTLTYSSSDLMCMYISVGSYNYNIEVDGFYDGGDNVVTVVNQLLFTAEDLIDGMRIYVLSKNSNVLVNYNANGGSFNQSTSGRYYPSGSTLFTFGGRRYYKKYASYAYVGWTFRQANWSWPMLVGTTANSVAYYTDYNTSITSTYAGTFTYNSKTYYYSSMGYHMQNQFDTSRKLPYVDVWHYMPSSSTYTGDQFLQWCAKRLLDYSGTTWEMWTNGSCVLPGYNPIRTGYYFSGWYTTSASSGGTKITASSSVPATNNVTYYARWIENTYYLEFYHPENGYSYSTTYTLKGTSTFTFPAGYCDPGYHLGYWEDDYNCYCWYEGDSYTANSLMSDVGSYGAEDGSWGYFYGFQEENQYYLEFYDDSGGSDGPVVTSSVYYTGSYTMPVEINPSIYRWGYHLQGWSTYNGYYGYAGDPIYVSDLVSYECLEYDNGAYISLYADWQEDETSSVTVSKGTGISSASFSASYDGVSGYLTGQTSNTGVYDGSSVTYTASVSSGYTFDGWYNGTTKVSTNTSYTTTVYNNTTLTAKATAVPATVYMKLALAGGATWPSGVSASARLNYTNTSGTSTYTTISASSATTTSVLSTKSVTVSNISFSDTKLAYVDYWVNTSGYNTNHSTGYHPSTSGFTVASSASGTYYVTLVFTYCNNSALLKYDSTNKYFYFEDGLYPQTYAGGSMSSTLNSWYTSNSAAYSMYINGKSVSVYNYSGTKYARIQAPKTVSNIQISTSTATFTGGTYYWFRLDPIRWRVSNYGVGSTAYPTMVKNRGVVASNQKVVSDLVLDWAPIYTSTTPEGWAYKDSSTIHSQIYSTNNTNLTNQSAFAYKGTGTYSFDAYSNTGTTVKVISSTSSMSGILQVSTEEISLNTSDIRAKASDLVCMLAGVSSGYCDYWTRDLTTLNNGLYVTSTGITRNRWLTSACGVRLAYTLSSVARTRD